MTSRSASHNAHGVDCRLLATAFETGQATLITDAEMRIKRADAALYQAKGRGRNRVMVDGQDRRISVES